MLSPEEIAALCEPIFAPFFDRWAPDIYLHPEAAHDFAECLATYYLRSNGIEAPS